VLFTGFNYGSAQTVTRSSPQTINARKEATADKAKKIQIGNSTRVARTDDE